MKRLALLLVALILFIFTGCINRDFPKDPPVLTASVDGKSIKVFQGSYCWGNKCVDMVSPEEITKNEKPFQAKPGDKIKLDFNFKNPTELGGVVYTKNSDYREISVKNYIITVPGEEGVYCYSVSGFWQVGEEKNTGQSSSYIFKVEVVGNKQSFKEQ